MIRLESHTAQYKQQENQHPQNAEFKWRNSNQPRFQGLSSFFAPEGRGDVKTWEWGWSLT